MNPLGNSLLDDSIGGDKVVTTLRKPMLLGVVLISFLLVAFGLLLAVVLLPAVRQNKPTDRWTEYTHQVLTEIADILINADDAETGQRGFLFIPAALIIDAAVAYLGWMIWMSRY